MSETTGCVLYGELSPWPTKERLAQILRAARIDCSIGRYSVRLHDCEHFSFESYGGDICEPQIDAEAQTPEKLHSDAMRVSTALAAAGIAHRFELYNSANKMFAYLSHNWPEGRPTPNPPCMTENDFWKQLELRVCREIESSTWASSGWWCDGFIPDQPDARFDVDPALHNPLHIRGLVWMARGGTHQEQWEFLAIKPKMPKGDTPWEELLPSPISHDWLTLDASAKKMTIALPFPRKAGVERYEHMWTTELADWIVICDNPNSTDFEKGAIFYNTATDATSLLEITEEARHVAKQLRAHGARVTDTHPTLGKPNPPRSGLRGLIDRLRGR